MAETQVTQQIVSESPEIEAYKLDLLRKASDLAYNVVTEVDPVTGRTRVVRQTTPLAEQLPAYQIAGFSPAQLAAMGAAEAQGVGAFMPYMDVANQALSQGFGTTAEAADVLRAADTRRQFADAQAAFQQAGGASAGITGGLGQLQTGVDYLDLAGQRALASDVTGRFAPAYQDLGTGINALATAQNMAARASQADLLPATAAIGQGLTGLTEAQRIAMGTAGADFAGSQALLGEAARRAGVTPDMLAAQQAIYGGIGQGQQAIGMAQQAAQQPGFGAAQGALGAAMGAAGRAGPSNFAAEVARLQGAGYTAADASRLAAQAAAQPGFGQAIGQGQQAIAMAQQAAAQPAIQQGIGALFRGAESGLAAAQQPGFGAAQQAIQQGMGAIGGAAQGFQPGATQAFMDPYRQQVIDETIRQINRQGEIAQQGLSAQAVRAGAFGGEREAVQRAELERNLQEQRSSTIANLLSQGYTQAQASAMAAFEQQQQRQMAAGQNIGQLGGQQAAIAAQQAGLGQQAAQMLQQAGTGTIGAGVQQAQLGQAAAQLAAQQAGLQGQLTSQQAQLQLQAAAQRFQQAGFDANTAMQMAQLQQTQQQQAAQQAGLYQGIGGLQGQLAGQQGALQQQAAQIAAQQAGLGVQAGSQLGALSAQQAQLGQAGAGLMANIGQTVGQQAAQQAQLGQAAAGLYGNLAQQQIAAGQGLGQLGVQQAQLGQSAANIYQQAAGQYGALAGQQGALAAQEATIQQNIANLLAAQGAQRGQAAQTMANIYGQQAGAFQNLGQGIGALAGQQFGIGQNIAQGLGALGGQLGQLGVQQAALGQTAQALQQGDINFLYNVGQAQQAFNQQAIDAQRATQLQQVYAPYQQAGFLSDIYRGAPSTQMSTTASSQPSASPFQQAVGVGLGALGAVTGAQKAGLFG